MILVVLIACLVTGLAGFSLLLLVVGLKTPFRPPVEVGAASLIANFFDTLGIGSFAPTTAYLKLRNILPDELIPASLIVGYAIPTGVEALIFIKGVSVNPQLLAGAIVSAVVGALIGSSVAARLPVRQIRLCMGVGLFIAAALFTLANLGLMPAGGAAISLRLPASVFACAVSFGLGVLTNVGIGLYGPMLISLSLLGLDPRAAFPIMMGSSALLQLTNGSKLLVSRTMDTSILLAMSVGGIPGVLAAAFIVRSLPLQPLRWGVVVVVTYAATIMLAGASRLRSARP